MSNLVLPDQLELAQLAGLVDARGRSLKAAQPGADTLITIHLGPGQTPEVAHIWRSQWPTVTALNDTRIREFHVRLRQHVSSRVCLVYASVPLDAKNRHQPSIFGDVLQRGRLCKTTEQIHAAIETIKKELGIEGPAKLTP